MALSVKELRALSEGIENGWRNFEYNWNGYVTYQRELYRRCKESRSQYARQTIETLVFWADESDYYDGSDIRGFLEDTNHDDFTAYSATL